MRERAKGIRGAWFDWPEAEYGRFNFQRDAWLDEMVELLGRKDGPAVVLLAGEKGIGRSYFCDAAAYRARQPGDEVGVWHLELEGFEPDTEHALGDFLEHLLEEEQRRSKTAREKTSKALVSLARTLSQTDAAASVLSLLWQFEEPLQRLGDMLSRPAGGHPGPQRDDSEMLRRLLDELTRERKLIVHVADPTQLRSRQRRWFVGQAERNPNLLLAISCRPQDETDEVVPSALVMRPPRRFDFGPLEPTELREVLDRRFAPNDFPEELIEALWVYGRGEPARIALKVQDLVEAEALVDDGEGAWHLPEEGIGAEAVVGEFSEEFYEPIRELIAGLGELGVQLRDFLILAALCGRDVPAELLCAHLRLTEEEAAELTDVIDDELVDELGVLWDLEFRHPAFPRINIYRFTHPLLPLVILDQVTELDAEMRAAALLPFLSERLPVARRAIARLFLAIAGHLDERDREPYLRQLGWWIGMDGAEELVEGVKVGIESQEVDPELVWRVVNESERYWPPYRRLALLEGYSQAVVGDEEPTSVLPLDRVARFHTLRARLLVDAGKYDEALVDARQAREMARPGALEDATSLDLEGLVLYEMGEAASSFHLLDRARRLFSDLLGPEHPSTLTSMNNLAGTLKSQGDLEGARELEDQALEARLRIQGPEHRGTLRSMGNLAHTLHSLGDLDGARKLGDQVLEALLRILGPEHPHTLRSMNNLADTLHSQGDLEAARTVQHQVLGANRRILGPEHPDTLKSMSNLGKTLHSQGDLEGARTLQYRVFGTHRRILGPEHPDTLKSMTYLATTLHSQGNLEDAREFQDQVLEAQRRILEPEHPDTLKSMGNLAKTLHSQGDLEAARKLEEQVLEARWRILGPEHPHTLASKRSLERIIEGQQEAGEPREKDVQDSEPLR